MKFQLAINLERMDDSLDMAAVADHTLDMVKMADQGGFDIVWAAEHHALEMTIAPNPFQILTWWAQHTENIRLGSAVAVAAYWHPINLAGEAAFLDLISGGRLEFGVGSGAYQREFDRMKPGLKQSDAWQYMQEMLPALRGLWAGDYEHDGEFWSFPRSTSVPKPLSEPRCWVAARSPITFDYALANDCHVMCWPIARPFAEAELYKQQFDDSVAKANLDPSATKPIFALMRHTALYENEAGHDAAVKAAQCQLGQFAGLFQNQGDVYDGFPRQLAVEELQNPEQYTAETLTENLMFGNPDEVIAKLKRYEQLGVDEFIYYASLGLGHAEQKRSMELFCAEVIPAFA